MQNPILMLIKHIDFQYTLWYYGYIAIFQLAHSSLVDLPFLKMVIFRKLFLYVRIP